MNSASAKVLPLAKRLYGANAPRPEGPLGGIPANRPKAENIDFNYPFQKEGHDRRSCPSFWVPAAFGRLHPSVIQMLGGNEFRLRQGFAFGKTLVRRKRAAAQKGRAADLSPR